MQQAFLQEQQQLASEEMALEKSGATQKELYSWQNQHAAQLLLQEQRAQTLAITSALKLQPTNRVPRIPVDASPTLQQFLSAQAVLANAQASIHNQLVQQATASGSSLTFTQVGQIQRQEQQLFWQQNADAIKLQAQRSQTLANASAQTTRPVPGAVVIPSHATSQMTAYLTTKSQIQLGLIQVRNEYASATPAVRDAAMQAWYKQNAGLITQLRQQAQNLSQAGSQTSSTIAN